MLKSTLCMKTLRADISVYLIVAFCNLHGADDYRGTFPWHGHGRPMGTNYAQYFIRPKNKRIIKCQRKFMWMQSTRKKHVW